MSVDTEMVAAQSASPAGDQLKAAAAAAQAKKAAEEAEADAEQATFTSRPYQEYMIEQTVRKNTIIFLPTGAGKTYIALQTIQRMSKSLEKSLADGGKRSVFLVNTVVLAKQQAAWMRRLTPLRIGCYTGELDLDAWQCERWRDEFERHQVIVATCQIVLDVIRHGYITLEQLNVLVFDECHNATRNHPMTQLMAFYQQLAPNGARPRIVGLSGSLLGSTVRPLTVLQELSRLESQFHATIMTVQSTADFVNVLLYSSHPEERLVRYFHGYKDKQSAVRRQIDGIVSRMLAVCEGWPLGSKQVASKTAFRSGQVKLTKYVRSLFTDFQFQMQELGMYGASLSIMSVMVELELSKRSSDSTLKRQLCRLAITAAERIRHAIVQLWQEPEAEEPPQQLADNPDQELTAATSNNKKNYMDEDQPELLQQLPTPIDSAETILTESTPKVLALIHFLCEHLAKMNDPGATLKCLVFVQRRQSAKLLYHLLRNYALAAPDRLPVRPDFMVGNNNALAESIHSVLELKWNAGVLERFKRGDTNLIVATSVLEEGVDLQECNLVVCFDGPASYRAYVQSKGRARMASSTYAVMVASDREAEMQRSLTEFREVDRVMRHYLVGKTVERMPPTAAESAHYFAGGDGVGSGSTLRTGAGAELHDVAAVQLVTRYALTLPTDEFHKTCVIWELLDTRTDGLRVRMRLPLQSPIKGWFSSAYARDVLVAKRSAALRACRALYECGELDEHLMPYAPTRIERSVSEQFGGGGAKAKLLQRRYAVRCPSEWHASMPVAGQKAYLYSIRMELETPAGEASPSASKSADTKAEFSRLFAGCSAGYAILTAKQLPPCAAFRLQSVAVGAVRVELARQPVAVDMSADGGEELAQLRRFHEYVFADVLNIAQPFLASDHDNLDYAYLIVPTAKLDGSAPSAAIDWTLVQQFQQSQLPVPSMYDGGGAATADFVARKKAKRVFRAEDYRGRVVYPWYRMDQERRYIVVRVHEHLTPFSPFPNETYASYAAYIEDKYQLQVANAGQFMLEVQCVNDGGLSCLGAQPEQKQFASRSAEMLIPELCENLAFPGDMWLKAVLLPGVLHRLQHLLGTEWLRRELNEQLGCPLPDTSAADFQQPPLVEQSNRNPTTHRCPEEIIPVRAIVIPNPEEAPVREIAHSEFRSLSQCVTSPWAAQIEPIDHSRHIAELFPFELDYFYNFVNDRMARLHMLEPATISGSGSSFHAAVKPPSAGALAAADANQPPSIRLLTQHLQPAGSMRGFDQAPLLAALTAPAAKDICDYRRQALLGDAVIRFLGALHLMRSRPHWHCGWLHAGHAALCDPANLAAGGIRCQLPGLMKCHPFVARNDWQPPLQCVPRAVQRAMRDAGAPRDSLFRLVLSAEERRNGEMGAANLAAFAETFQLYGFGCRRIEATVPAETTEDPADDGGSPVDASLSSFLGEQSVGDQSVAEAVRAICGEAANAVGLQRTAAVLRYFAVFGTSAEASNAEQLDSTLLDGPLRAARLQSGGAADAKQQQDERIEALLVNCAQLEQTLGYAFRERAYLLQALTHISYADNQVTDCQQTLTFLGTHLCDLLITAYVAQHAEHLSADQLRDLRAALGANLALACYAVRSGMHAHMLAANQAMSEKVAQFLAFQEMHEWRLTDRVLLLVEEADVRMGEFVDVPAAIGGTFAAVVAAVYLDCGRSLPRTWECLWRLVRPDVERLMWQVPGGVVQRLEDWPGAKPRFDRPHVEEDVVMVTVRFTRRSEVVQMHGFGRTAEAAKVAAAKVAMHALLQ